MSAIVSMKRRLLALTPQWMQRNYFRRREQVRLAALPTGLFDTSALGKFSDQSLNSALRDPVLAVACDAAFHRIDALKIVAFAGGVNQGDRKALFTLVAWLKPRSVLEVGTHIGASTASTASALASIRKEPASSSELTTVDILDVNDPATKPWLSNGSPMSPVEILAKLGVHDRVKFVAEPSLQFLESTEEKYDLIFLDGDHSASTVYSEVPLALRRLNPGGLILLHDYYPGGMPLWRNGSVVYGPWLAIDRVFSEGVPIRPVSFGDLPWETKHASHRSSLAVLSRL